MHPTGPISAKDVRRHYLPWCKRNANEPRGLRRYGTDLGGTKPGQDGTERHQTTRTARDRRSHNPEVAIQPAQREKPQVVLRTLREFRGPLRGRAALSKPR